MSFPLLLSRYKNLERILSGGASFDPTVLQTSLIAWWTLDESSDGSGAVTRNDSHGTNHLTDTNTTASSASGKVSRAADFETVNLEYLSIADNAALSMGDIDFTMAAWVKFESAPDNNQNRTILAKYNSGANKREYFLAWRRIDASSLNHIVFTVSSNGTATTALSATSLGTPVIGTWYFVRVWHDAIANTLNIQVNNGAVDSVAYTAGVFDSDSIFMIGSNNATAAWYMDGLVDEAAIWKRTQTEEEGTWLYNDGDGRTYTDVNPT